MEIHTSNLLPRAMANEPLSKTPETSDINWFSATIESPSPTEAKPMVSSLAQSSNFLHSLSNQSGNDLKRLSKSSDPMDIIATTRSLSSLSTEVTLAAKIVNKSVQAVEKLTNLS
ncbi:type III secretion system inner rod subunit SctI [Pseudomonas sp. 15FMM2]|uniref:Type III secretion system inner rod subunit SctI n=1 Tax=Pseudomonas imrae TaxID=2992837 RepID=A0ACC7P765_9PSED